MLKELRWLLLKERGNLDADHDARARLEEVLRLNKPLAVAYYLKKDLRQLWHQDGETSSASFLRDGSDAL